MLSRIIQWSGRNPFLVLLATLFVVLGGVVAVMKTPLDALPDLSEQDIGSVKSGAKARVTTTA